MSLALAVSGGAVVGLATGLLPGVHVNTVCAVALAVAVPAGPVACVALAAMAVAHAFASNLPSTYLGAPGEETLLSALPAHRMLLEGRGPDAVQASLDGGLAGLAFAIVAVLPYKWLLAEPGRLLDWLEASMAWVLAGILVLLVLRERRRGLVGMGWAAGLLATSGLLGLLGTKVAVQAIVPIATTPLLPMLSGLFGAPALVETMRAKPLVPEQQPADRPPVRIRRLCVAGAALGAGAAAATAMLPGLTSSVAAAAANPRERDDARPLLSTLAAIATAQVVLTFVVLWLSLRARTGLAVAVQQLWHVEAWTVGTPPVPLRLLLTACLAAGILAHIATAGLAGPASRILPRLPQRVVASVALSVLGGVVILFSGAWGTGLFLVSAMVGLLPLAAGLGRVHLTGCLLVPVLLHRLGWA